ncbi:MAG: tetratricopeptide repeat protein [Verrucomicrobiota bacterium]
MPALINGCGTRYAGRKNLTVRYGACKSCGRHGALSSYDTRLCLTLLFIPLLPVAGKHIIDECASCRRHYVMKLREWETRRQLDISGGLEDFRQDPSVEKGMAAHAAMVGFREMEQAETLRRQLESMFPDSTRLQLYLASVDREHGQPDRADAAVERAFRLSPELPETRFAMAGAHRRAGRLDEARKLIDLLEQPGAGALHPLSELELLAYAFQNASRHQPAYDLLRHLVRELPGVAQHPGFRKNMRKSEKALGFGVTAMPKRDRSLKTLMADKNSRKYVLVGLAAVLIAGGMVIRNEYTRRHRTVTLVNGWKSPVKISVDGGPAVTVAPGKIEEVTVREGNHRAEVSGAVTEGIDFQVETGYAERWSKSPAFVLNPGGAVPLEFVKATYSASSPVPDFAYAIGKRFSRYDDIDYLFRDLPQTVSVKRSQSKTLTGLTIAREEPGDLLAYVAGREGIPAALNAAETVLTLTPENEDALAAYRSFVRNDADQKRVLGFLEKGLALRPVPVRGFRAWQDLHLTRVEKEAALNTCQDLLRAEPENADLLYLTGRAMPEETEAVPLYEKARRLAPENPWPAFALGYLKMEQGRWPEARDLLAKADALLPGDGRFSSTLAEVRLGCGEGADMARELAKADRYDAGAQFLRLRALAAAGDREQGETVRKKILEDLTSQRVDADVTRSISNHWFYMSGQFEELAKRIRKDQTPSGKAARVWLDLQNGDLPAAALSIKAAHEDDNPLVHMALWVAAGLAAHEEEAAGNQETVVADLKETGGSGMKAADLILKKTDITLEELEDIYLEPVQKALLCAGLIPSHPGQREFLATQARLYNADLRFPAALVTKAIGGTSVPPP